MYMKDKTGPPNPLKALVYLDKLTFNYSNYFKTMWNNLTVNNVI